MLVAHFVCYPLMFVGAGAGMSVAIVLQKQALLALDVSREPTSGFQRWLMNNVALSAGDAAVFEQIMRPTGLVLAAAFVLVHVAAVPWARAARRRVLGRACGEDVKSARTLWIAVSAGITGAVVFAGLMGWAIILFSA